MKKLSPEAQAVLHAYDNSPFDEDLGDHAAVAAALRAVAYQVAEDWNEETCDKIIRIAAELESAN
jgi:DNA-binding MurR/RpiR family transcriptional regulator